jgi:hypothetical protein
MRGPLLVLFCVACHSPPQPSPVIIVPEGGDAADPCAIESAITRERLIRNPDGSSLVIHCDGSTTDVTRP